MQCLQCQQENPPHRSINALGRINGLFLRPPGRVLPSAPACGQALPMALAASPACQPGLTRASLYDYRLGHILDALFAANLNKVFRVVALKALEIYAIPTPWLHQDTTTIGLYGAYEDEPKTPGAPRPAYGHNKDGRDDLKQVLLSLGVGGDGGIPLCLGVRDDNRSDSVETPGAIEECLALGLEGMRGVVADSKAYSRRTLGLCLEKSIGLVTLVPRTCAVRQELEAWGQQQSTLPLLVEKPGRTQAEAPRRWHGQSVLRQVEVEYSDGRVAQEALRMVVVHSSQLAQQQTQSDALGLDDSWYTVPSAQKNGRGIQTP